MTDDATAQGAAAAENGGAACKSAVSDRVEPQGLFPERPVADQGKGRLGFFLVFIGYAIVDFGRLHWVPVGPDTAQVWHVFYASYAELFYHHDLAHWFPYGVYGQPNTLYNLLDITPTDYLMMALGKVFHFKNAILLFQLSLMADHVLLLFGIHLLARSLFRRQSSVWLCLIGSIALLNGLNLSAIYVLRMVTWYPLILYFLVRFFRDRRPVSLWLAGTIFTFMCLGHAYHQPYVILGIVPFVAVATWKHPGAWCTIFRFRWSSLAAMALFVVSAGVYLYLASHVMEGITTARPGRALSGGTAPDDFVAKTATDPTVFRMVISFFAGHGFYIGLLPFGCVLWGLFRARTPLFAVFMVAALLVAWFCLGGLFSLLLYHYVPFVSFMHYLAHGFFLVPVPLLLAAGAAWDRFEPARKDWKLWLALPVLIFLTMDFCLYADSFPLTTKNLDLFFSSCRWAVIKLAMYAGLLGLAALVAFAYHCSRRRTEADRNPKSEIRNPKSDSPPYVGGYKLSGLMSFRSLAVAALLTGLFVDVFQYSYRSGTPANPTLDSFRDNAPGTWEPVNKSSPVYQVCFVQPLTWQSERLDQPVDERAKVVLETTVGFVNMYAFAQFDPCREATPEQRTIGTAMQKLLALRNENDPALKTILGCHAPKLRLMTRAQYVNSEAEAAEAVRSRADLASVVILQWPGDSPKPPMPRSPPAGSPGSVRVTDFGANAIEIQANVTVPEGAWLVYADTYDPRWRAWVNGKLAPVVPAYVGLKAVWVPQGESVVRMKFSTWSNVGLRVLASGGALCSLSLLLYCGICCIRGFPSSQPKVSIKPTQSQTQTSSVTDTPCGSRN